MTKQTKQATKAPAWLNRDLGKLLKAADRRDRESKKQAWEDDAGMRKMFLQDAKDLRKIIDLITTGDLKKAARKTYNLDTDVQDLFPSRLYNWLEDIRTQVRS